MLDPAAIRPRNDRILVRLDPPETKTAGGLWIPEQLVQPGGRREDPMRATVVRCGPGKLLDSGARMEPRVKAGDRILFGRWAGYPLPMIDELHRMIRDEDVMVVVEDE